MTSPSAERGLHRDDDTAGLVPGVDSPVRLDDVVERHGPVDHRHEGTRLDELDEEVELGRLGARVAEAREGDRRPATPAEPARERGLQHDRARRHGRQVDAVAREGRPGCAERALADGVEDHVVGVAGVGEVAPGVVDHALGPQLPHERLVRRTADADDRRAEVPRQLHGGRAHRAGCPVHEHHLARLHIGEVAEERQRGEESVDGRDRLDLVEPGGHVGDRTAFRDLQELGVRADRGRDRAEDAVARREPAHPGADALDAPGEVGTEHRMLRPREAEEEPREPRGPGAPSAVGGSHGRRVDAHEQLVLADHRVVALFDAHHVGCSVSFVHCGSHDAVSSRSGYWNTSSSGTPKTRAIWKAISSEGE